MLDQCHVTGDIREVVKFVIRRSAGDVPSSATRPGYAARRLERKDARAHEL